MSGINSSPFFGFQDAEKAYQSVKLSTVPLSIWGFTCGLAVIFMMVESIKIFKQTRDKDTGKVDVRDLMNLLTPYLITTLVIVAVPVIITTVEAIFGLIEKELVFTFSKGTSNTMMEAVAAEGKGRATSGFLSILQMDSSSFIDSIGIWLIKPIAYFIDKWLLCIALSGRYLYLMLLEIVSPLAIVCLLSKKTDAYFYTWCKNMLACFLLLPAFLIASTIAEAIKLAMITDSGMSTPAIIGCLVIKLALIKQAAVLVKSLI